MHCVQNLYIIVPHCNERFPTHRVGIFITTLREQCITVRFPTHCE